MTGWKVAGRRNDGFRQALKLTNGLRGRADVECVLFPHQRKSDWRMFYFRPLGRDAYRDLQPTFRANLSAVLLKTDAVQMYHR